MVSTTTKGNIGEYYVCADLTERGYTVLSPLGNHPHYDLVVEKDGKFEKVQVKYINIKNDVLSVKLYTTDGSGKINIHSFGVVDIFAVYEPIGKNVYYLKLKDFPKNKVVINLRMGLPKNNQKIGIRFAKDYLTL